MMTQSVITQTMNLFGNTQTSTNAKSRQAGSGFDLFIGNAGQGTSGSKEGASVRKDSVQTKDTNYQKDNSTDRKTHNNNSTSTSQKDNSNSVDSSKRANGSREMDRTNSPKKTDETSRETMTAKESSETENLTKDEQLMANILGTLQQVREAIMEILQLSPEEFDQLIANYQALNGEMSAADLLQPDTLRQLALLNSGETDPLSVLTDESLADTMKQLLESVDQIKAASDLPLTQEQIKAILEQVKEQTPADAFSGQNDLQNRKTTNQNENGNSEYIVNENKGQTNSEASIHKEGLTDVSNLSVSKEGATETQTNNGKGEDSNLDTTDQFDAFVDKLVQANQTTQVDFSGNVTRITELRDIANQIIDRIKVTVNTDQSSMELQLNPEHLGKVNLTIQSKNGVMTAQFVVQNELSKEAIEGQMQTLRETLNQQGLKVDTIEVTVSEYAFEQSNQADQENQPEGQNNQSGRKNSLDEALAMSEVSEEESSITDTDALRGSQVDYTA